jgi:hypothetical protein
LIKKASFIALGETSATVGKGGLEGALSEGAPGEVADLKNKAGLELLLKSRVHLIV